MSGPLNGGAARGALNLHRALREQGVSSNIVGTDLAGEEPGYRPYATGWTSSCRFGLWRAWDTALPRLYLRKPKTIFSTGITGCDITRIPEYRTADVIHLHWVNGGFVNIRHLRKVGKPIVWTLRDMWPFTGGCHYSLDCTGYERRCGSCPQLGSTSDFDLSRFVWRGKRQFLPSQLVVVGLSNWISECAKKSSLFCGSQIHTIPNSIDTSVFRPIEKAAARAKLGISQTAKVIVFGAINSNAFYKGGGQLKDAIKRLSDGAYVFVYFGKFDSGRELPANIDLRDQGHINDDNLLATIYSAGDVFLSTSLQDAFQKTLAEAMACGTPVVALDAGGPRDIVDHLKTGYLAEPYSVDDIVRGVNWVMDDEAHRQMLAQAGVERVNRLFGLEVVAKKYRSLYEKILDDGEKVIAADPLPQTSRMTW